MGDHNSFQRGAPEPPGRPSRATTMRQQWMDEVNFDETGAYIGAVNDSAAAHALDEQQQYPSAHDEHSEGMALLAAHPPATALLPSFEAYLTVPMAYVAQHSHNRSEATLLHDVAALGMEMDVILESIVEQLHDRERIGSGLERVLRSKQPGAMRMDTTLLVLQKQAQQVNDRNFSTLFQRFQRCLSALFDLQCSLQQFAECNRLMGQQLKLHSATQEQAQRLQALTEAEELLLERIQTLEKTEMIPLENEAAEAGDLLSQGISQGLVACWSGSSRSEESKRSSTSSSLLQYSPSPTSFSPLPRARTQAATELNQSPQPPSPTQENERTGTRPRSGEASNGSSHDGRELHSQPIYSSQI